MRLAFFWFLALLSNLLWAQTGDDGFGQTLQIHTRLHAFVGRPTWTLIIRDVDHGQNIPYIYDISQGTNEWFIFTYSHNYMILASILAFSPYTQAPSPYTSKKITNFCHLQTGRILRNQSMRIMLIGDLTPNPNTYACKIAIFPEHDFYIAPQEGT